MQQPSPSGFTVPSPINPVGSVGSPFPSAQSPLAVGSPRRPHPTLEPSAHDRLQPASRHLPSLEALVRRPRRAARPRDRPAGSARERSPAAEAVDLPHRPRLQHDLLRRVRAPAPCAGRGRRLPLHAAPWRSRQTTPQCFLVFISHDTLKN